MPDCVLPPRLSTGRAEFWPCLVPLSPAWQLQPQWDSFRRHAVVRRRAAKCRIAVTRTNPPLAEIGLRLPVLTPFSERYPAVRLRVNAIPFRLARPTEQVSVDVLLPLALPVADAEGVHRDLAIARRADGLTCPNCSPPRRLPPR